MPTEAADDQEVRADDATEEAAPDKAGQSETLTLAQVQKLLEAQDRAIQSRMDKREARLMQRLQQDGKVKELATKHNITPEALAELRGAFVPPDEDAEPGQKRQPDQQRQQTPDWTPDAIQAKADEIAEKYGLQMDDPEQEYIVTDGSLEDYFASVRAAGIAKSVRLKQTPAKPARSPAMIPGGGKANQKNNWAQMSEGDLLREAAAEARRSS